MTPPSNREPSPINYEPSALSAEAPSPGAAGHSSPCSAPEAPPKFRPSPRSFWALIGVMFQGALSDNVYKLILMMMVIALANQTHSGDVEKSTALAGMFQTIVNAAFILPYVLAVSLAGWLGDRFSKTRVTQGTKILEIVIMALALWMFALGHVWTSVGVLFLMGMQSALFSPAKYGILAEILPPAKISWGNGLLQGFTFLAIILGTLLGPMMYETFEHKLWIAGLILVGLAVGGYLISLLMERTPPAAPGQQFEINPIPMVMRYGGEIWRHAGVRWAVLGMVTWWLAAVMLQSAALLITSQILGLSPARQGIALLPIVVGLGLGCMITSYISKDRIELGLVPFGALAMCAACVLVWAAVPGVARLEHLTAAEKAWLRVELPLLMGLAGLVCGFVIVPLQSFVVQESDPQLRGGVWAASNVLTSLGMMLGAAICGALTGAKFSPGVVFLVGGLLMLAASAVICWRFPTIPMRFFISFLFRSLYRTRVIGLENLPAKGGALLTANHQSYLDAVLIATLTERPVRFIMAEELYRKWYIWPLARLTNSIPISSFQSPRAIIQALREARAEIQRGGLVGIFPEGQMTRIGIMTPFRRGLEIAMRGLENPIIPIAIDGAYETSLALRGGKFRPRPRIVAPGKRKAINIAVGKPMPPTSTHQEVRRSIVELMVDAFAMRKQDARPLHREALSAMRRQPFAKLLADHASNGFVPNYRVLAGAAALGRRLAPKWKDQEMIGILLPPCIGAAAVNLAAALGGRIAVNLNYTASLSIAQTICEQCSIRMVITSGAFWEKAKLEIPPGIEIVDLDILRPSIGLFERWTALARAFLQPAASLERALGRDKPARMDDVCTLIFSSGSTGIPKGIELTHWNLWSNITAAYQAFHFPPQTRLLGILPFFHSFGYMVTFWLPLMKSLGVSYFPTPLNSRAIGEIAERHQITHLLATPTFLSIYTRRVLPGQFGSLICAIAGAEKLRDSVAEAFAERFGIYPIEGFGSTECSPAVAVNVINHREPGFFQRGSRRGTVGQPLPGVCARIVDPDTNEPVAPGKPGMLLVRGPNVMRGYYQMPEKTAEAIRDGWYVTGDIARMDDEGFVTITDRLSRFSKIGGEMVPHIRIEDALLNAAGINDPVFAVTGIPDAAKGERLVVLYAMTEAKARAAWEKLQDSSLPPLWIPKWTDFSRVEAIPLLGTGKMDLRQVKALAQAAFPPGARKTAA